jgi:hypothetical protein
LGADLRGASLGEGAYIVIPHRSEPTRQSIADIIAARLSSSSTAVYSSVAATLA